MQESKITEIMQARRSIRQFTNTPVARELLEKIIEAGMAAPSAKNRQPWHCVLLEGEKKEAFIKAMECGLEKEQTAQAKLPGFAYGIADAKNTIRVMRGAPVLLAVLNSNGTTPFHPIDVEGRFVEQCDMLSIGAFIQNMLLAAQQEGIGSLWIANTCFAYEELVEFLQTQEQLVSVVAFGYAAQQPKKRPRKTLQEILTV